MLSVENLDAGYRNRPVLHNVTLTIAAGEFLGILGPNGCGKTTLLRVLRDDVKPRKGCVRLKGQSIQTIAKQRLARIMAYLPQDLAIDLDFTVRELVLMGRNPHLTPFRRESGGGPKRGPTGDGVGQRVAVGRPAGYGP